MDKKEKKLKIGVLGLGAISQAGHLEAVRRGRNTELVAICDVAEDLCQRMAYVHHVPQIYTDYDQMLKDPNVEAVILGVAHEYHVACAMKALKAGKHVLVEKPLGIGIEECEQLKNELERSGLVLQIGNMKRFDPGIAFGKDFIKHEIGHVVTINAWYCADKYRHVYGKNIQPIIEVSELSKRSGYQKNSDYKTYKLLDHCSHLLDTARFFGGEIASLQARYFTKGDVSTWQIATDYKNGAIGNLDFSLGIRMDWHEGFFVYGEHGSLIGKIFNPWYFKSSEVEAFSEKTGLFTRPLGPDANCYRLQVESFADVIMNGAEMQGADIDDGIAAIQGLLAIQESQKTGQFVKLDEVKGVL